MGIQGFFNFIKRGYAGKRDDGNQAFFRSKQRQPYNYVFLDYQALFYNIVNLYREVNYLIRLLHDLKDKCATAVNPFYDATGNVTNDYRIVFYIINNFPNLFTKLGLRLSNVNSYMPVLNPKHDIAKQQQENKSKIGKILSFFPITEDFFIDVVVEDIVDHTNFIAGQHLRVTRGTFDPKQCYIFFDGIPSIAKMKEQLSRRVGITVFKYINQNIVDITPDDANITREKEMIAKFVPEAIPIGKDTPVVNKTRDRLVEIGYNVNDNNKYGEAEHQIMKKLSEAQFNGKSILLSSPDADLILLGMISSKMNNLTMSIYREAAMVEGVMDFSYRYDVDAGTGTVTSPYKRDINYILLPKLMTNLGLTSIQKVFDICYLFLLLGDDFIPIIQTFNVMALEKILEVYNALITATPEFKVINLAPLSINYDNLVTFLDKLKDKEATIYADKSSRHASAISKRKSQADGDFRGIKSFLKIDSTREIIKKTQVYLEKGLLINPDKSTELLINPLAPVPAVAAADLNKIIKKYLEGCQFIFDLYFINEIKNYKWHYTYDFSPKVSEIVAYLKTIPSVDRPALFDYSNGLNIKAKFDYMDIPMYKAYSLENKNKALRDIYERIVPPAAGSSPIPPSTALTDAEMKAAFTYANIKKIFSCNNQVYFNKCIDYDDSMIDPDLPAFNKEIDPALLKKYYYQKYLKYKSKYLSLKNMEI